MRNGVLDRTKKLLEHVEYYNKLSPFPIYDTEYVETIKKHIEDMENKEDYDKDPVVACSHCKSLHIIVDEDENNVCMKCGSINEIDIYSNIFEYEDKNYR